MAADRFEILSDQLDGWLSAEDLNTLRKTEATAGTFAQFAYELKVLKQKDLHPFGGHVWFSGQWNKSREAEDLQVGVKIDGLRYIAERTGQYDGQEGPFWCGQDGEWREVWLEDEPPAAAKVLIYRKDMNRPLAGIARWSDYVSTNRKGEPSYMWEKMGPHMLAKCGEALGFRKAFPNNTSNLYTDDEMNQAGVDEQAPARSQEAAQQAAPQEVTAGSDVDVLNRSLEEAGAKELNESPDEEQPEPKPERPKTTKDRADALNDALLGGDESAQAAEDRAENGGHNGPKKISKGQLKRAYAICANESDFTKAGMKRLAERRYNRESLTELNRAEYDSFIRDLESKQLAARYNRDPDTKDLFEGDEQAGSEPEANGDLRYSEKTKAWARLHRACGGQVPGILMARLTFGEGAQQANDLTGDMVDAINSLMNDAAPIVRDMPWSDAETTADAFQWILEENESITSSEELREAFDAYADHRIQSAAE